MWPTAALFCSLCVCALSCTGSDASTPRSFEYGWTQTWGSSNGDYAWSLATSEAGLHVAGAMYGDPTDVAWLDRSGNGVVGVATLDARGEFMRRVRLDGPRTEVRPRTAATADGALYVAGVGEAVELPHELGAARKFQQEGYVLRFEASGERAWSHSWHLTAPSFELGIQPSIAITSGGDVIVAAVRDAGPVAFIARLRASDGSEVWNNRLQTDVRAVAAQGDAIYVYGNERRINVDQGWLRKLDSEGHELWTRTWGDEGSTDFSANSPAGGPAAGAQLAVLPDGGVAVAGSFVSVAERAGFDAQTFVRTHGGADVFVAAFTPSGARRWVLGWGGRWNDGVGGLAVAPDGSLFTAGWFQQAVVMPDGEQLQGAKIDALVVALAADGGYLGARVFGGPEDDLASDVGVLPDGALAVSGSFERSVDFGFASEADVRTSLGHSDAYLTQFRFEPE